MLSSETRKLAFCSLKKAISLGRGSSPCQTAWSNRKFISGTKFVFSWRSYGERSKLPDQT